MKRKFYNLEAKKVNIIESFFYTFYITSNFEMKGMLVDCFVCPTTYNVL